MALADAHIKGALGEGLLHEIHRGAAWHCCRDAHYFIVGLGEFYQGLSEHILIFRRLAAVVASEALAGLLVEGARCVPGGGVFLGRFISLAFHGVQVHDLGSGHVLDMLEHLDEFFHIVAVEGAKIADVQTLEDILLARDERLHGVVEAHD